MLRQRLLSILLAGAVLIAFAGTALGADKYVLDVSHTLVGFTTKHLVINKVRGKFNDFAGVIMFDENDVTKSSMSGTIKTASIDTDNQKRDDHLRSADFFDVQNHPEITFQSTSIAKQGDGYLMHGTLTMRGVTKNIVVPFSITGKVTHGGKTRIGFEAKLELNRQDYGISWSKTMDAGGLVVSDTVQIELLGEAIQEG